MSGITRVAALVEGEGEEDAIVPLLQRVWHEYLQAPTQLLVRPLLRDRSEFVDRGKLDKALKLARLDLRRSPQAQGFVLILFDADHDLPCELAPKILGWAAELAEDLDVACVLPNKEFETWFVASAPSLENWLDLTEPIPEDPESGRSGKAWIEDRYRTKARQRGKSKAYSPSADQKKLVGALDLMRVRELSPSFDKLVRELEKRLP